MAEETLIFNNLDKLAKYLRSQDKKYTLLFAHNGTGKTRLSEVFKNKGKNADGSSRDTLYFNAFTEDLFNWDNDLENDNDRGLIFNANSHFFDGLDGADIENRIRPFLYRYVDFDFQINYENRRIIFSRQIKKVVYVNGNPTETTERIDNIKVSRGEENIFIWCFFLAIAQMAIDKEENYRWVKYLYIDDPISSLDDNHAIDVACNLAQLLKQEGNTIKTIISTHHGLFFNVMHNELKRANKFFLNRLKSENGYSLINTKDTPFFHHVVMVQYLQKAAETGKLYTYHFNMLRNVLEKTAAFFGYDNFGVCIKQDEDDTEGIIRARRINILSHGNYSIFNPTEMQDENKEHFKKIVDDYINTYRYNSELFEELERE